MAKQKSVNKSQAIRDYFETHPEAMPKDVMAALAEEGIKVTRVHVGKIKMGLKGAGKPKKAANKQESVEAPAPAPAATPAKPNGTITLEQVKKVAQTVSAMGGFQRMTEVMEVIKEAGGVKKFKDLAEAITVPGTDDISC